MAGWNPPPRRKWHISRVLYWPLLLASWGWTLNWSDNYISLVRGRPCNWAYEEPLSLQLWPLCIWATEQDSGWGRLTFLGKSPCSHDQWEPSSQLTCSVGHLYEAQMYSHSLAIPRGSTTYYSSQTFLSPVLQIIFFPSSWTSDSVEPYLKPFLLLSKVNNQMYQFSGKILLLHCLSWPTPMWVWNVAAICFWLVP